MRMLVMGFTLLEVLIAMLVLAIGVMGGSAMQLTALRARHESLLLSGATQMAAGMAERMRANAAQIDAVYATLDYDAAAEPTPSAPAHQCWDGGCDSAQAALADLYDLKQQVSASLPSGRARICRDAAMWHGARLRWACAGGPGAQLVVKVGWRGKRPDGASTGDNSGDYAPGVAIAVAGAAP